MNITMNSIKRIFCSKILVRLWLIMMFLVVFGMVFMWVVQIFLFEQNYVDATVAEVRNRLQPIMGEIINQDLAGNEQMLLLMSKAIDGKLALFGSEGTIFAVYNAGQKLHDVKTLESMKSIVLRVMRSEEYEKTLAGDLYERVLHNDAGSMSLEICIPVTYNNQKASVLMIYSLGQLDTVLNINRSQLKRLSIILTIFAALLAAFLSRRFVKPIRIINDTVNSLAKGDLEATPNLSLDDELGQLSDSVAELGQVLRRLDVLRKEVIANVSHELRAPLSLIKGYAEMVRDINWKEDNKRNDNLNLIIREADRMGEMVSDIMDYSQFQAGFIQLKKDWYNLCEIVESEIDRSCQSASEHGITILLDSEKDDIQVEVDALKISQVIRNLLNNAVNHTADYETVSVAIKETNNVIKVSVINPGGPIPEEEREIIWERYQRSQHSGGRKKGTGIGLSIVSTFLKAHDMSFGVDCANGFTTFWFEYSMAKTARSS